VGDLKEGGGEFRGGTMKKGLSSPCASDRLDLGWGFVGDSLAENGR